jgi:hypothetical protein
MSDVNPNSRDAEQSENPFAVSELQFAPIADAVDMTNADRVRTEHLSAEASVRAIGGLQIFGALIFILAVIGQLTSGAFGVFEVIVLALIATFSFIIGRGLRNLKNWARITTAILSVLNILNPITWYILYCLLNKKGAFVCTPEYAAIRAATPHLRYYTPITSKLMFILFIVLVVGLVILLLS